MISVKVTGLDDLKRQLERLSGDDQTNVMKSAFINGAMTYQATIKELCPVKTGQLQQAIEVKTSVRKGQVTVKTGIYGSGLNYKGETFYAPMVELGHYAGKRTALSKIHDKKKNSSGRQWVDGKHFIRQAADIHKSDVPQMIVNEIAAGIERLC